MSTFAESITLDQLNEDPYPIYARLRKEEPVAFLPAIDQWMVTRWDDVVAVVSRPQSFTTHFPQSLVAQVCGPGNMLGTEGDAHAELRACVDVDYSTETVHRFFADDVRRLSEKYAETIAGRGEAELKRDYLGPIAVLSEAKVLGLDQVDPEIFLRWSRGLNTGITNFEHDPAKQRLGEDTAAEINRALTPTVERYTKNPNQSTLSNLIHAGRPPGNPRTLEEVLPTLRLVMSAIEEPSVAACYALLGLFGRPEQYAAVKADLSLLPAAVHEALRWISPVGALMRSAPHQVTLAGVTIPEGAPVAAIVASANRDETVFDDPDRFDLYRTPHPHVSLGYARHRCLAIDFVPEIVRISLEVLLERLPGLRPDPDRPPAYHGWRYRHPDSLHVRW
ncbi:cytochrome P450 [Actinomadura sp. ATCC 31491]|uniref:Cytochrome P450 n=1 Tax=Actinomadura luzonensis TaxID=2805427 RepID=A0ABT0FSU1_9ACTN|nr:cytochrome P450 [Actinomadura luzonensis]MCK2215409.1 cytochrome P450 [Actinomadura luzonensis]